MSIEELSKELPSLLNEPNKKLLALYKEKYPAVEQLKKIMEELKSKDEKFKDYNLTMQFLAVPDKYLKMKKKIMIVGQEMGGGDWCKGEPENWMRETIGFQENPGASGVTKSNPFWRAISTLSKVINGQEADAFDSVVWTNIRQLSYHPTKESGLSGNHTGKISLEDELLEYYEENMLDLLEKQIEIVKPDVVVFFTGPTPKYEKTLKETIKDLEYLSIDGFEHGEFVRLKSSILPKHSYRTYHPGFHNEYSESLRTKVIDAIKNEIEK